MSTNEEAEQAISKFNGQEIDGRRLQVEKAKEGGGPRRSGGGFGGGGGRGGYGGGGGQRRW
jgi:RNA recognition motif-containing protein